MRKNRKLSGEQQELHFRLPIELHTTVEQHSKRLGLSKACFIQDALECYISDLERIAEFDRTHREGLGLNTSAE